MSACSLARATMFRTCARTITEWPEWIRQLRIASRELLPLSCLGTNFLSPPCWDSSAFACNLQEAWLCFPSDKIVNGSTRRAMNHLCVLNGFGEGREASPGQFRLGCIQKSVYKEICLHMFQQTLANFLARKVCCLLDLPAVAVSEAELTLAIECLRKGRMHESMQCIKTGPTAGPHPVDTTNLLFSLACSDATLRVTL